MKLSFGGIREILADRSIICGQGTLNIGHSYPDSPHTEKHLELCPAVDNSQRSSVSGIPQSCWSHGSVPSHSTPWEKPVSPAESRRSPGQEFKGQRQGLMILRSALLATAKCLFELLAHVYLFLPLIVALMGKKLLWK